MRRILTGILLSLFTTICYAGPGATLTINDISNFAVVKDSANETSHRIDWKLPSRIEPGAKQWSHIEFSTNVFGGGVFTDTASTIYTVECPNKQLEKITIKAYVTPLTDVPWFHKNYRPEISVSVSSLNCVSVYAINATSPSVGDWNVPFVEDGNIQIYITNYPS